MWLVPVTVTALTYENLVPVTFLNPEYKLSDALNKVDTVISVHLIQLHFLGPRASSAVTKDYELFILASTV